jgi:radical SAM superfamily enzyme YgiQ (UPF0313 family)
MKTQLRKAKIEMRAKKESKGAKQAAKNILLIRPSSSLGELTKTSASQHPINLLYIAAYIRQSGYNVKILDMEVESLNKGELTKFSPDVVGISAMTPLINKSSEICNKLKSFLPKKPLFVVGGNHVTAIPKETLEESPVFDIGVIGEGEETFGEICSGKRPRDILGIVYREGRKVAVNKRRPLIENLDSLPYPARDLIDLNKYRGASTPGMSREFMRITELFINRGCNWGMCTFCASMLTHCKFRTRSIDNIIGEAKECIQKYRITHFTIDDDTLTTSKERTLEFCRKIRQFNVTWDCDSRVSIDREMALAMKEAGCKKIAFGVESGSQRVLGLIKKGITINQIKNAFQYCREAGIETCAFFLIGSHPDETWGDLALSKKLIKEIKPDYITASVVTPYPGTELRRQMEARNLIFNNDWSNYGMYNALPQWRTTNFSPEDLLRIQQDMIRSFYLRPNYILKRLIKIRSIRELRYYIRAFFSLNKSIIQKRIRKPNKTYG